MVSDEPVLYEVDESGIASIRLNRPENHNALSDELTDALIKAFTRAHDDGMVRCIIVESHRAGTFSAGGNLATHLSEDPLPKKHDDKRRFPRLFSMMRSLGKPIIAAVDGHCLAGGLGLALACDLVIASERATFGTPEIDIGLFPFIVMPLVVRSVSSKHALQLMLLGEAVSAEEAARFGFVNRVVATEEVHDAAYSWARTLASKSPFLLRLGKDAFYRQENLTFEDAEEYMLALLALAFSTEDLHEGINAFFERRPPRWMGR
jgi:3-hydroxypropionyl-coenzyme A dehydratase